MPRKSSLSRFRLSWVAALCIWVGLTLDLSAQPAPPIEAANEESTDEPKNPDEVHLSFEGASIDVIVKWLAEMTGKSIVKHKEVDVKLNVLSSNGIPKAEAIQLVYGALALEGFVAIENRNVIVIVPEKLASKAGTEILTASDGAPIGRQIVMQVFELRNAQAEKVKKALTALVSKEGKLEVDERANKVIIQDYGDNVRLVSELVRELDIPTQSDTITEVFPLQFMEAESVAQILSQVFGQKGAAPKNARNRKRKGKAATPATDNITILPDNTSNRVVVSAPAVKMGEIRQLIETLDARKPRDVGVRVVPLTHVNAQELVREVRRLYSRMQGKSLKERIEIAANTRSNTLIVLSSEQNYREIVSLVENLDTEDAEQRATRTFSLKHADAEDLALQLEELYDDGLPSWRRREAVKILFVPNRRRNEIIAIGSPATLDRVSEMIEILDEPVSDEDLAPRIFPIKYSDAAGIKKVLDELFIKKSNDRPWWAQSDSSDEVGRLFGKVRFATDPFSNSIIVTTNSAENFEVIERILAQLDRRSPDREETLYVQLNHAKAVTVSNNLNILFAGPGARAWSPRARRPNQPRNTNNNNNNRSPNAEGFEIDEDDTEEAFFPWLGGQGRGNNRNREGSNRSVSDLVGQVRVVPDSRTNSLLITTAPHYFPQVRSLVQRLDVATPQVLIEARILEVKADNEDRTGVRWSPNGDQVFESDDFDDSLIATGTGSYSETFLGSMMQDALRTGVVSGNLNLDVLVQFLSRTNNTRLRASPRLNVADNERAKLFVGARIPFISQTLNTVEGGQNNSFEYRDVGITLEVTPNINANGDVDLKVRVESSQIRPGETLFGGAILDTRNYRTELAVRNNQIVVLGGIIQTEESEVIRKVPLLGDIPLLGWLFKKRDKLQRDVELLVFLKTTVTRSLEDVEQMMESERRQSPRIQNWIDDLERAAREDRGELREQRRRRGPPEDR